MSSWGFGGIGNSSISTLVKDLRKKIQDEKDEDYSINYDEYTMEEVSDIVFDFFYNQNYLPLYEEYESPPPLAFFIAGYSSGGNNPELWRLAMDKEGPQYPTCIRNEQSSGVNWGGEGDAIERLIKGRGKKFRDVFKKMLQSEEQIDPAMQEIESNLEVQLATPAMPIQDAIDLSYFLSETAINFTKFIPGAPTVGGPIDIATITKHEGFKWIKRKHFFSKEYNP